MTKVQMIRAWMDENYRRSLNETERAKLPPHPSGLIELADAELEVVVGRMPNTYATNCSLGCRCY
jgi:mersacidin/lichenicidin family type 2 lantibiotic